MCGHLGLHYILLFLHGLGIIWAKISACIAHWASISAIPLLALAMGLVVVSPAILTCWVCYLFASASLAHLLYLYLLLLSWACWLLFLSHWPIGLATSFFGLLQLIYFIFTSYSSYEPVDYHSCHVSPLGLMTRFFHSYFFFLPFPLLLGFFRYWVFCQKWASTPTYSPFVRKKIF